MRSGHPSAIDDRIRRAIERITGHRIVQAVSLSGGCIAEIYRIALADGSILAAKIGGARGDLVLEGWMLDYLGHHSELPVPKVIHAADNLLLLEHIETSGPLNEHAERHAAELLAKLHGIRGRRFGLERDTLIGPVTQPNRQLSEWLEFFRDRRLLHMAGEALAAARIDAAMMRRVENLAGRLDRWIEEPAFPALIHGDMWGGNVLVRGGRIAAFVDPSIYYADPEIELAFGTLFGTFGADFFARYGEIRPLSPGFFEARRDIYNLYPLLVHSRLFGGAYPGAVDRILSRFGC